MTSTERLLLRVNKTPIINSTTAVPRRNQESTLSMTSLDKECFKAESITRISFTTPAPTVRTFLRVKNNENNSEKNYEECFYEVQNNSILTRVPTDINTKSSRVHRTNDAICKKFSFNKVFKAETSQAALFEETVQDQVMDFLMGQSSTIMSFGTTNSGKTFTMYGTPSVPGIIPRSIEYIFSVINCTLSPWYKVDYGKVTSLDDSERAIESMKKNILLNSKLINESKCSSNARTSLKNSELETSVKERDECSEEAMYCVWISFVEIYNENIYDLLTITDEEKYPLLLTSGGNGLPYVKGLKYVYVTTALEALRVLMAGQSKMSVAATSLNSNSSRSHTIFTVRLLRYLKENSPEEVEVSTLTFCDLAGSGGTRNIDDVNQRLIEARSINNSFLVLGRCLKTMHKSQMKQNVDCTSGLFRESKLTRMFQKALSGRETLTIIVNLDTTSKLLVETQNILNICAITKKIIVEPKKNILKIYNSTFTETPKSSSYELFVSSSYDPSNNVNSVICEDFKRLKEQSISLITQDDDPDNYLERDYSVPEKFVNCFYNLIENFRRIWQNEHMQCINLPWFMDINEECSKTLDILGKNNSYIHIIESCKEINTNKIGKSLRRNYEDTVTQVKTLGILITEREKNLGQEIISNYSILFDKMITYVKKQLEINFDTYPIEIATAEVEVNLLDPNEYQILQDENKVLREKVEDLNKALVNRECEVRQELADRYLSLIETVEEAWKKRTKEMENEGQDLLKWSVQQIEHFYKERINNIIKSRKRRKIEDIEEEDEEESSELADLIAENTQITSKIVVLKEEITKLKDLNRKILVEHNAYRFELSLVKDENKRIEDLLKTIFAKYKINTNACNNNLINFLQKLKEFIDTQFEDIETLEKELSDREPLLAESLKEIDYLKEELSDKSKYLETLKIQMEIQRQKLVHVKQILCENQIFSCTDEDSEKTTTDSECKMNDVTSTVYCYENSSVDICSDIKDSDFVKEASYLSLCSADLFIKDDSSDPVFPITKIDVDAKEKQVNVEKYPKCKYRIPKVSLNVSYDGRTSFLESSESINHSIFRSSDESSKNDSGIVTKDSCSNKSPYSSVCGNIKEQDDKSSEILGENANNLIETISKNNRLDSTFLIPPVTKSPNIMERLLQELSGHQRTIQKLNETGEENKRKILEYEYKLKMKDEEIKHLNELKNQVLLQNNTSVKLEKNMKEYEREISELSRKLQIREETENVTVKKLEQFFDKFTNLENQLCATQTHLEMARLKCTSEHASKVEELEKELYDKTTKINEMAGKISEANCDFARVEDLTDKINEFETLLNIRRREDDYFRRQMFENSQMQLNLNYKLKRCISKEESNENALANLKLEINKIIHANTVNNNKAKEFGIRIEEIHLTINKIKDDILQTRELRKNMEASCTKQIVDIRSDLSDFLKTSLFPNLVCTYKEEKEDEINQLKLQLEEKEKQMILFQKNKDSLIEKYESLIMWLQNKVKTKETHFSHSNMFCSTCAKKSISLVREQKKQEKNSRFSYIQYYKKSSSQIKEMNNCKVSDVGNVFSEISSIEDTDDFNQDGDIEQLREPSIKTETEGEAFVNHSCCANFTNIPKESDRLKWIGVSKFNVEAEFLFQSGEERTDFSTESSEDESNVSSCLSTFERK